MTQPIYNVYRGKGTFALMTYRVNIFTDGVQFYCDTHWENSWCTLSDIATDFPLVAKNVRFKA